MTTRSKHDGTSVTTALVAGVLALLMAVLSGCDAAVSASPPPNPLAGRTLYVDPMSPAARDAAALAADDPETAAELREIAERSHADWFGDWNPPERVTQDVAARVSTITAAGAYPVLVAYNIPLRDCGSYSGGGAASAESYRSWIKAFAAGIGSNQAAVILEPDALGHLDCLSPADQQTRLRLLHDAVLALTARGTVTVYIDAGHADWVPPLVMADRLSKAGVAAARGFSLNVSSFGLTADQIAYGRKVAPLIGWKRFVIDTSRNGRGPATGITEPWCNPPGRGLGAAPTAVTGDALVDAYLWVKPPGESDGTCNGGPPAGTWWRDYAEGLVERAA